MLWVFPDDIDVANYRLLAPALTATYALTPLVMRGRWRPEVLRVQMIYSFAHAVAIFHTLRRRTADWVPTGAAGKGTPLAVKIRRLMTITVVTGQTLLWAGIARDFGALGIGRLWPMLALGVVTAYVQLPALMPLQESRPDGALRRPHFPAPAAAAVAADDRPTVFRSRGPRVRVPAGR
jgi:cellulose synthase (UDP-forming)